MRSLKLLISLLAVLVPVCASCAEAQERSTDYDRVTSADIKWVPLPSLPKGAQIAVLHGSLGKPGLFTMRVKLPPHFKLPVHSHPDERVRTIISGTYYSALGDKVDETKLTAFPPGTFSN